MGSIPGGVHEQFSQAAAQSDRRRTPRFDLDMSLRVRPANNQSRVIQGRIVDLSRGGMNAVISADMPLGTALVVEFVLPYAFTIVRLGAVVRFRNSYQYGMQFVNITDADQAKLNRACAALELLQ